MTFDLAVGAPTGLAVGPFSHPTYTIRRPFFQLFGRYFKVLAPDTSLALFVKHPLFSFRDEWTIFADEAQTRPVVTVKLRKALSFDRTHDITDAQSGALLGSFRMQKLKSIVRDSWELLDASGAVVGALTEDSMGLLRRFVPLLLGKWHLELGGATVAVVKQNFAFFTKEFALDVSQNNGRLDPRVAMAGALLALTREINREKGG